MSNSGFAHRFFTHRAILRWPNGLSLQRSRGTIDANKPTKNLLRIHRAGGFLQSYSGESSELISQTYLEYPGRGDDAMTTAAGDAKRGASDIAIYVAEGVAVERVRNVQLENEFVRFKQRRPLDDGKIFVEETGITNVAER